MAGLTANPGPDGISLREAIEATNRDPGSYAIRFAPALAARSITLASVLPALTSGGVTIEGDIDGNGTTDLTLQAPAATPLKWGLWVASGGNRLHALTLQGFLTGVLIQPEGPSFPTHQTHAGNVVSGLTIRAAACGEAHCFSGGIWLVSALDPSCGAPNAQRCLSYHRWTNTTISGNTIEGDTTGIKIQLNNVGDRFEHATVTDNTIEIRKQEDAGIALETAGDSTEAAISDVLIARNSIEGAGAGINLIAGAQRGQTGTIEDVRVLDNRIRLVRQQGFCCGGIGVQAGSDDPSFTKMVRPPRYLDGNVVRNVLVRGNSVSGTLVAGVGISVGGGAGGSRNLVQDVRIERNVLRSSTVASGVNLVAGGGTPFKNRYATGNRIAGVAIDANVITLGKANPLDTVDLYLGGVVLIGGGNLSRDNAVRGVRITSNRIATTLVGIKLVGGSSPTARGNSVACVRLAGNRLTGVREALSVRPNLGGASGNRASLGGC